MRLVMIGKRSTNITFMNTCKKSQKRFNISLDFQMQFKNLALFITKIHNAKKIQYLLDI